MGGESSYTELLTCLEMARDVRNMRSEAEGKGKAAAPGAPGTPGAAGTPPRWTGAEISGRLAIGRAAAMIIQTASPGTPRLAVMMHEHTALCAQFARAFGNDRFESLSPLDLMVYVIGHHDAGWTEFDRDPVTDEKTGLPYNLVETPAEHITVTSRLSPTSTSGSIPIAV